ncbi:MAG: hypothetical protein LBI11_02745 [Streptococcaceae bacterium]|jgi:hypothetical protein|nr:hypothetical protein [Streptococcaceae bacterium]
MDAEIGLYVKDQNAPKDNYSIAGKNVADDSKAIGGKDWAPAASAQDQIRMVNTLIVPTGILFWLCKQSTYQALAIISLCSCLRRASRNSQKKVLKQNLALFSLEC